MDYLIFISSLAGTLKYIVILYPYDIPDAVWRRINVFEAVLVVRGSPLEENDLRRAGRCVSGYRF